MNTVISPATHIIVKGARQHNLKNINLVLPKNKLIVFTGLSGSGKSSLAFDTIYAEGQRRYVESLSSYARQFLGIMQKPDVDSIDGLAPAISIDQKTTSHNPRSTVGTITEIYDYLRLLYARIGHPHCPTCGQEIAPQSIDQIVNQVVNLFVHTHVHPHSRWFISSPVVRDKKGEFSGLWENLQKKGFERVRVDGRIYELKEDILLIKTNRHTIEVIIDRFTITRDLIEDNHKFDALSKRTFASIQTALELSQGLVTVSEIHDQAFEFPLHPTKFSDHIYSQQLACPNCNTSFAPLEPRLFSFNTPQGACSTCTGLGSLLKIDPDKIVAPDISLSEGAIIPLASALSTDSWYARKLAVVVEQNGGSYTQAYRSLSDQVKKVILYGDKRYYTVTGRNKQGREASFSFIPEGIIPELERRYHETHSDFIRAEISRFMKKELCPQCQGARLKSSALAVTVDKQNIHAVVTLAIKDLQILIKKWHDNSKSLKPTVFSQSEADISRSILREINLRVDFLSSVGLDYLTLHREASTLAGGEAQRIRLASQIGTGLTGVLYVLDEPTIGLHPRDNERLISTLTRLRDLGNTVIVVEHDQRVIESADYIVDFGPRAGEHGGEIVAQGTVTNICAKSESLTGQYLSGNKKITPLLLTKAAKKLPPGLLTPRQVNSINLFNSKITLVGASSHNLKNITVDFPLNRLVVVTGVSGSGKSTLIHDTLYPALKKALNQAYEQSLENIQLYGTDQITKVSLIDQSPIGRTPRSNPATYTKAFDLIRLIYSQTKSARTLGYLPGRFSFNVKGGRCEACQGGGEVKIEMQFLSDVYITCEVCQGKRYNSETLSVLYQGVSIADILNFTIDYAASFFKNNPALSKKLATLQAVGLGYLKLGQSAPTLSGGEAQRVKLAKELSQAASGHTVYLLDEPTTGLHFEDVKHLLVVLKSLVEQNNTVIVIEHNLDVIKNADWIIDLGPEGGAGGGDIVASGPPESIIANKTSFTGQFLQSLLS